MTKDEALKLALDAFGEIAWSNNSQWQADRAKVAITALQEALAEQPAQPEQEPVAYASSVEWRKNQLMSKAQFDSCLPKNRVDFDVPLYTRPQAREWVGLTDNEVLDMARTFGAQPWPPGSCVALGQMIEAKLREKNA